MPAVQRPYGTFVKTNPDTGEMQERVAYTPHDVVRFEFDGFVKKQESTASSRSASGKPQSDNK